MIKVLSVFGTRPEAIKMAPVVKALQAHPEIDSRVCVTGQHRQILDQVLTLFQITPDHDLDIMVANQRLSYTTGKVLTLIDELLDVEKPDWLFVQGDTTTAMAAAMAAFYQNVPVGHIEAGLRTHNIQQPFPEEVNRRVIDLVSSLHFAPSQLARQHLLDEQLPADKIVLTGNTIVDAVHYILAAHPTALDESSLGYMPSPGRRLILVTAHRRENFGAPLERICQAVRAVARQHPDVDVLLPVHPNPNVKETVYAMLGGTANIQLTDPLDYATFMILLNHAYLVLTDSGGIQEEATTLGKPVLVMRELTERAEAIHAGCAKLVGTQTTEIVRTVEQLLADHDCYAAMSQRSNVYGDGLASQRIVTALLDATHS